MTYTTQLQNGAELNRLYESDRPVHEWYRFVLSFPPHLVRHYVDKFGLCEGQIILDPFCGTGTTLVEAKKLGIGSVGVEANAMAHFAASVKTDWDVERNELAKFGQEVANTVSATSYESVHASGDNHFGVSVYDGQLRKLDAERSRLLIKNSISPLPLHKVLTLLDSIERHNPGKLRNHAKLALARQTVKEISNLRFGPEIGVGKLKVDAPVLEPWLRALDMMAADLHECHGKRDTRARCSWQTRGTCAVTWRQVRLTRLSRRRHIRMKRIIVVQRVLNRYCLASCRAEQTCVNRSSNSSGRILAASTKRMKTTIGSVTFR